MKAQNPDVQVILLTAYFTEDLEDLISRALDENVYTFLAKPVEMEKLFAAIRQGLNAKKYGEFQKPGMQ